MFFYVLPNKDKKQHGTKNHNGDENDGKGKCGKKFVQIEKVIDSPYEIYLLVYIILNVNELDFSCHI